MQPTSSLLAGAADKEITPQDPVQLYGYPHVRRISEGVHDPLRVSALYLNDGKQAVLLAALDILFLDTPDARDCRARVAEKLGIPESAVLITCTHTHSGPVSMARKLFFNPQDPSQAPPAPGYIDFVKSQIIAAATAAQAAAAPAVLAWTAARVSGVGTNRHNPEWTTDPECGILAVRRAADRAMLGLATIYGMHPTVMHEDSRLISSDFPHYTREHLRESFGQDLVACYHNAPCGNQSPRHVVKGQTFDEAERLGRILGRAVADAVGQLKPDDYRASVKLGSDLRQTDLPRRQFPPSETACRTLEDYRRQHRELTAAGAPRADIRTAECAIFGAEKLVKLAQAAEDGSLDKMLEDCLPADVQTLLIGDRCLVGLPGELFTEYALQIKAGAPGTFPIAYANGTLQGYIVTPDAAAAGGYEAAGSVMAPEAGERLVETALAAVTGLRAS